MPYVLFECLSAFTTASQLKRSTVLTIETTDPIEMTDSLHSQQPQSESQRQSAIENDGGAPRHGGSAITLAKALCDDGETRSTEARARRPHFVHVAQPHGLSRCPTPSPRSLPMSTHRDAEATYGLAPRCRSRASQARHRQEHLPRRRRTPYGRTGTRSGKGLASLTRPIHLGVRK